MEPFPLVLVVVAGFAFVASEFQSKPIVAFQDSLIEETSDDSNARHGYHCYTRRCYYNSHCQTGQFCYYGRCCQYSYPSGYCRSQSGCKSYQCCSKHNSQQAYGICRNLKKPGEFCPLKPDGYHCGCTSGYQCQRYWGNYYWGKCVKPPCSSDSNCYKTHCCSGGQCKLKKGAGQFCPVNGADKYHCGCASGFECRRYRGNRYWGKCACSGDSSCAKTHCCSGGLCKPRKKAGEYCPLKGADIYHCGCIQGYQCTAANVGNYWGKCTKVVPPTEEPGSGIGEIE